MNIGIFTETYKPNINGVVTSIEIKKKELEKLGNKVYIVAPEEPGYVEEDEGVIRLKSFTLIFQPEYRLAYPPTISEIKKVKRLKLDILHAETPFSLGLIAKYFGKLYKKPVVHTYHTLFPEYVHYVVPQREWSTKTAEKLSAMFCNGCNHIIAPSFEVKDELLRYGVKKEITVIPTGIDIKELEKGNGVEIRKKFDILENEKLLLFVGRLGKEKNIEFLIESIEKLVKKDKNIKLMLVGDGPEKENLKKQIKVKNIDKNIIFTGYVDRSEISNYYAASDIFIFSSLTETQGLVILEAMSVGKPVVAIRASGVSEMVVDGVSGYLTKNSIDDFNLKILEVLENENLAKQFSESAVKIASEFKQDVLVKKMYKIYVKVLRVYKRRNLVRKKRRRDIGLIFKRGASHRRNNF